MRYGAWEGAVHPHNQVILATHRTLITTINDSPVPFLRVERILLYPTSSFRMADSSVRTRPTFRQSTVIGINDSAREVSLLSPVVRRAKSTFCSEGFQDITETVTTMLSSYQVDKLINREAIVCHLVSAN